MLGIDTNVVVRLIISDDAEQTRRARKLIEQAFSHDEPVLVSLLVVLESEWVLRSRYGFNRETLLSITSVRLTTISPMQPFEVTILFSIFGVVST